jgi:hypothetical protein
VWQYGWWRNIVETGADGHMIEEYIVVKHIAKGIW